MVCFGLTEEAGRIPAAAEAVPKTRRREAAHPREFQLEPAFPQAEVRKKMMVEACLFADIADTFAAVLLSYLSAVLRVPPAFVARPDTAPDTGFGTARGTANRTVSDIPPLIAPHIVAEIRVALGALRPVGNLLDPASVLHPAGIRFRADDSRPLVTPLVL